MLTPDIEDYVYDGARGRLDSLTGRAAFLLLYDDFISLDSIVFPGAGRTPSSQCSPMALVLMASRRDRGITALDQRGHLAAQDSRRLKRKGLIASSLGGSGWCRHSSFFDGVLVYGVQGTGCWEQRRLAHARDGETEDRQLLLASGRGDRKAFARLVVRHRGLVARVAGRYGLSPPDADDLAQEAFSRAWDAAPGWADDGPPFAAWLYRVASNLAIDALRRNKRRPVASLEAASMVVDDAPEPGRAVWQAELASAVRAALLDLPERQRLAIELVHLESRSGVETAALLGTSIGALEGLLSRARRELRIVLAKRGLAAAKDWAEDM